MNGFWGDIKSIKLLDIDKVCWSFVSQVVFVLRFISIFLSLRHITYSSTMKYEIAV